MTKPQKRCFLETITNNETKSGHTHNARMYTDCFQDHLYVETASSRFEVLTKPTIYKCKEDRPYYATQNQDFFHYKESFNSDRGKPSAELKDVHLTIPNDAPSITRYTKANVRYGFVIPQESPVYNKSENYKFFNKQCWFGVIHPTVQNDAILDYTISGVLLEMDQKSLSFYMTLCNLNCDLK